MTVISVSDYIVARLCRLGIDMAFLVTGGGSMYLNNSIGNASSIRKIYCHHEQGAAIAAEAYARIAEKPALLNVTTGPGGINALNGVFGAYTDSIPMIIVSGQVKRETLRDFSSNIGLRQLGDQEVDILSMAKCITKYCHLLKGANDIFDVLDDAMREATSGRPGPVWIDVPVDLQGVMLEIHEDFVNRPLQWSVDEGASDALIAQADEVLDMLENARRPVLFGGSGVRIAKSTESFIAFAEQRKLPLVTAWTHDLVPSDHELFVGRPGTIGTRAGNFIVQNADLVIILGSRLNVRQVSYNWSSFARQAKKVWVDIDPAEFRKPFVKADLEVLADAKVFLKILSDRLRMRNKSRGFHRWLHWCQNIRGAYTPKAADYPVSKDRINPYHFVAALFDHLKEGDIVVCGNATATIVPYQIGALKKGMRLISNSGSASMGYDIPAAIGAAAAKSDARVVCLAGDGSAMMNIQELQTISGLNLNVTVFILDNDGYLSIKQTQKNFFGREAGASSGSGLSFPDFLKIGRAFGLNSFRLNKRNWRNKLKTFIELSGPTLCCVELDLKQEFEPRLKSKMIDGVITTPELDDMYPFLPVDELERVRAEAMKI